MRVSKRGALLGAALAMLAAATGARADDAAGFPNKPIRV